MIAILIISDAAGSCAAKGTAAEPRPHPAGSAPSRSKRHGPDRNPGRSRPQQRSNRAPGEAAPIPNLSAARPLAGHAPEGGHRRLLQRLVVPQLPAGPARAVTQTRGARGRVGARARACKS